MTQTKQKLTIFIVIIGLLIAAGAGIVYSIRGNLTQSFIQQVAEWMTGTDAEVRGNVKIDFGKSRISVERLDVKNFPDYESPLLAQISDIEIEYPNLRSLLWDKKHPTSIVARIEAIHVEYNAQGKVNIAQLRAISPDALKLPIDHAGFSANKLDLSYGAVYYHERRSDLPQEDVEVDIQSKRDVFSKFTDPYILVQVPVLTTIASLKKGSLGVGRAEIQERIRTAQTKPAAG